MWPWARATRTRRRRSAWPRSPNLPQALRAGTLLQNLSHDWLDAYLHSLARIPEVLEIHHVAGEDCFLLKVRARDAEHLGDHAHLAAALLEATQVDEAGGDDLAGADARDPPDREEHAALAGDLDDDVLVALGGDLGLGYAGAVDALVDDAGGLLEALRRHPVADGGQPVDVSRADRSQRRRAGSAVHDVDARRDPNFLIMARTDIRAVEGLDAAIDRAKALVDAGADAIFPEAMRDLSEFEAVRAAIDVPVLASACQQASTRRARARRGRRRRCPR